MKVESQQRHRPWSRQRHDGADQLEEGVDFAVVNDYRQSLTEVLGHWQREIDADNVFPGFKPTPALGLFA